MNDQGEADLFCINCIHYAEGSEGAICTHESLLGRNLVTGKSLVHFCEDLRYRGSCGRGAVMFEAIPDWNGQGN